VSAILTVTLNPTVDLTVEVDRLISERVFLIRLDRQEAAAMIGRPIDGFAAAATVLLPGIEVFQRSTVDALVAEVRTQTVVREIGASPDFAPPQRRQTARSDGDRGP
jgi:hypothetical protein